MTDKSKSNVLWEKHRVYLPEMREKATGSCGQCKFFVSIIGKSERRAGCVANIKAYRSLARAVPPEIAVVEIIRLVGLEGLERSLQCSGPEAQGCGSFTPGAGPGG